MKTSQSTKPKASFTSKDNEYRHIFFVPTRGDWRLSIPGRETTFHDSLTAAIRVRDFYFSEPAEPGPAPITPQSFGYFNQKEYR
jgi:hypothetical protein